jgi:FKBP-type peptidyl-prolyl cis-trans isomerase
MALQQKMAAAAAAAGEKQLALGNDYLAKNKAKPGVTVTASGLQYEVITGGSGPKPAATSTVKVHYHGTLIDGQVFDSSVERKEPIEFALNRVIAGWTEGPAIDVGRRQVAADHPAGHRLRRARQGRYPAERRADLRGRTAGDQVNGRDCAEGE